jgi:hypothetical protein
MVVTRLTDAVIPAVFVPYMLKETMTLSAIFQSGILRQDAQLSSFLSGGGQTVNVPFWNDLADTSTANISSDDPAVTAAPDKIVAATDIAVRNNRNKAWSDADLVSELAGDDPMKRISSRVSSWWAREFQRYLVSTLRGVIANNISANGSDMCVVIGTDAVGAPAAAEKVSANAILDAAQTMGDASDVLDTIIMHSVVYTNLAKQNLIDFIPDSEGKVRFPSYLGYQVVKDDGCPAVAGTNRIMYHTYLVGKNAMGWAEVPPDVPVETFRYPAQGNGAGVEELWTRRQWVMHPYGIKWTSTSMAGRSPTDAELRTTTNWSRVYPERKQIPIACLQTNG